MSRYRAIEGSQSGHCCFDGTVVDTTRKNSIHHDLFAIVCECFDFADAEMIAAALNANAENAKLRKHAEAMAECKALADGMANMIRGFIFKTVERESLDGMAAKYRKWEEDYCRRNGA